MVCSSEDCSRRNSSRHRRRGRLRQGFVLQCAFPLPLHCLLIYISLFSRWSLGLFDGTLRNAIELKTNVSINSARAEQTFETKLLKHWAQSFLLGIPVRPLPLCPSSLPLFLFFFFFLPVDAFVPLSILLGDPSRVSSLHSSRHPIPPNLPDTRHPAHGAREA
jgi:hypothetical protein